MHSTHAHLNISTALGNVRHLLILQKKLNGYHLSDEKSFIFNKRSLIWHGKSWITAMRFLV